MAQIIFILIVIVWFFIGFLGVTHSKEDRTNYEMIIFLLVIPFLPIIAKICDLF